MAKDWGFVDNELRITCADAIELVRLGIKRFLNRQPNSGFLSSKLLQRMRELYPDP